AMHRRADRTNFLARRVFALHAGDGLKKGLRVARAALVVTVNAQPVHLAPAHDFGFADDRNVVLRLAGHDASAAADARIQINRHPPGVTRILEVLIERMILCWRLLFEAGEVRMLAIFVERCRSHQLAPFHIVMKLRVSQRESLARLAQAEAGAGPRRIRGAGPISVGARNIASGPRTTRG